MFIALIISLSLCVQITDMETESLPEIPEVWELEAQDYALSTNTLGITPNIIKKSVERLEVLMHKKRYSMMSPGLVKSCSARSLCRDAGPFYENDFDGSEIRSEAQEKMLNKSYRIFSYHEDLDRLADYDPHVFNNMDVRVKRFLSEESNREKYEIKKEDVEDPEKFNKKMKSFVTELKIELDKLDGCSSKKKSGPFHRVSLKHKKNKSKISTEPIDEEINREPENHINTLEVSPSGNFSVDNNTKSIEDPSKTLEGTSSGRRHSFISTAFLKHVFKNNKKEVKECEVDESDSTKEIKETIVRENSIDEPQGDHKFLFHYIPNSVKMCLVENDLIQYKKTFSEACIMFNANKDVFLSFRSLVGAYQSFQKKHLPPVNLTSVKTGFWSLFETKSSKIKYTLSKLGELGDTDKIYDYIHEGEKRIYLTEKIISHLKECTKNSDKSEVAFSTCIKNVKYDITFLDLAFYTLSQYCCTKL